MRQAKDLFCIHCDGKPRTMQYERVTPIDLDNDLPPFELWKCYVCERTVRLPRSYGEDTELDRRWRKVHGIWMQNKRGNAPPHPEIDLETFETKEEKLLNQEAARQFKPKSKSKPKKTGKKRRRRTRKS